MNHPGNPLCSPCPLSTVSSDSSPGEGAGDAASVSPNSTDCWPDPEMHGYQQEVGRQGWGQGVTAPLPVSESSSTYG